MKRQTRRKASAPSIKKAVAKTSRTLRSKVAQAKVAHDVATASAETIAYRAAMIGKAGLSHPEVATMTSEKLLVAGRAATAMMMQFGKGHRLWTDFWFQQMQRSLAALPRLTDRPSPLRMMEVAATSAGTMMSDCAAFWMKATNFTDMVANAGAKPIHNAVLANARRLSRVA